MVGSWPSVALDTVRISTQMLLTATWLVTAAKKSNVYGRYKIGDKNDLCIFHSDLYVRLDQFHLHAAKTTTHEISQTATRKTMSHLLDPEGSYILIL